MSSLHFWEFLYAGPYPECFMYINSWMALKITQCPSLPLHSYHQLPDSGLVISPLDHIAS